LKRTLVVSDLHLGGSSGAAVLERPAAREALLAALAGVERLVLLGDLIELRHGRRSEALARARPFFAQLGRAFAGREVVVLAGNHDHALIEEWRRRRDEDGAQAPMELEQRMAPAEASSMVAAMAEWAAPARVSVAYPGLWLREDVYATHGHYLDCHLSVPTMECLGIGMTARSLGKRTSELESVADYEGVIAPVYAWIDAVARQAPTGSALNGQSTVRMWRALGGDRDNAERGGRTRGSGTGRGEGPGRHGAPGLRDAPGRNGDRRCRDAPTRNEDSGHDHQGEPAIDAGRTGNAADSGGPAALAALGPALRRRALAGAFPVAVAALNRLGLGTFKADVSAPELRRAGLRAMGEVAGRLGLGNAHVIFGHTHRAGPRSQDNGGEWLAGCGARLLNTGCWTYDAYFLRGGPGESPYWPGGAVLVEEEGAPQLLRLLDGVPAELLRPDRA
jgi:hypothetical protein